MSSATKLSKIPTRNTESVALTAFMSKFPYKESADEIYQTATDRILFSTIEVRTRLLIDTSSTSEDLLCTPAIGKFNSTEPTTRIGNTFSVPDMGRTRIRLLAYRRRTEDPDSPLPYKKALEVYAMRASEIHKTFVPCISA